MSKTTLTSGYVTSGSGITAQPHSYTTSTTTTAPITIQPKETSSRWNTYWPEYEFIEWDGTIDWWEKFLETFMDKHTKTVKVPDPIKKVIFNYPATIVFWKDGTKTIVKCQYGEIYDKEKGIALCFMKKFFENKGYFNDILKKYVIEDDEEL